MLHGKAQTIRLYGIDTPEKAQAYGTRAKQFTSTLAFGKPVKVFSKGMDRYGRVLAWIFVGSTCVNAQLVSNGLAWWYRQYSPNEAKLAQLEAQARSARRGLWADAAPVAPWEYRRPKRH
jgi:endonuclease YncB( thermonuclease family)